LKHYCDDDDADDDDDDDDDVDGRWLLTCVISHQRQCCANRYEDDDYADNGVNARL